MKQVLSLLVAFVFLQVQTWAAGGGPVYPGSTASLSGTYAGTIVGEVFFDASGGIITTTATQAAANGSGIFIIGQPTAGLASGVFAMFASGTTYTGAVIAIADPTQLTLDGVMEGQANLVETATQTVNGVPTTVNVTFTEGLLGISFQTSIEVNASTGVPGTGNSTLITGTGDADYQGINQTTGALFQIGSSTLIITGFLQSTTVSSEISLTTLTGTQAPPASGG